MGLNGGIVINVGGVVVIAGKLVTGVTSGAITRAFVIAASLGERMVLDINQFVS